MSDGVPTSDLEAAQSEDQGRSRPSLWLVLAAIIAIIILLWLLMSCVSGTSTSDSEYSSAAIEVPDVVGMERSEAVEVLSQAGLGADIRKQPSDDEPAGTVLRQSPEGGTQTSPGIDILLEVAEGPVVPDEPLENQVQDTVPYVLGNMEADAAHKIEMAGYQAAVGYVGSEIALPGKVLTQYPAAGAEAPLGSVVHVQVAVGEGVSASVTVPSVEGLSLAAANSRIRGAGLEPFAMERPYPAPYQETSDQWPEAGTKVDGGAYVYFVYGIQDF